MKERKNEIVIDLLDLKDNIKTCDKSCAEIIIDNAIKLINELSETR